MFDVGRSSFMADISETPPYNAKLITHHITSVAGIPSMIRLKSSNFGLNLFFAALATLIHIANQTATGRIFEKK